MKLKFISGVVVVVLLVTGVVVIPTFAQEEDSACQDEKAVIASVLGVEESAVETALDNGTLAELAAENDIALSTIAIALVDNEIACESESQAEILPEIVCASLENPRDIDIRFGMVGYFGWEGAAADALGLEMDDLFDRTLSIAALAEQQGIDVQTVIDEIVEDASEMIYQQNQAGFITDEQANARLETLVQDVTEFVNQDPTEQEIVSVLEAAREALGLENTAFYRALVEGKTLAQIASENNVSEDDLLNAVITAATTNLELAREYGFLSDCVVDVRLTRLSEQAADYINEENPMDLIFSPIMPAFSFSMGELGDFNFEMMPLPDVEFFEAIPAWPFEFDGEGFEFDFRPGEHGFFSEGMFNFDLENCDVLESFGNGTVTIQTLPGERGDIQIITPEGEFNLGDAIADCFEVESED